MKSKSGFSQIINTVLIIIVLISAVFMTFVTVCAVQRKPVMIFGNCVMQIMTGSMSPILQVGDCVIVQKIPIDQLSPGDVIAYLSESPQINGLMVMHRIVKILPDGSFITQGDANPIPDDLPVRPDQIYGKYLRKSPFFTWLTSFANFRKVLLLLVMSMITVMAFYEVRSISQITKEIRSESAEERRERLIREAINKEKERLAKEHYQPEQEEKS